MSEKEGQCDTDPSDTRPDCKYGEDCYQRNEIHRKKYKHPPRKYYEERLSMELQAKAQGDVVMAEGSVHEATKNKQVNKGDASPATNSSTDDYSDSEPPPKKTRLESSSTGIGRRSPNQLKGSPNKLSLVEPADKEPRKFIKEHFLVDMPHDFYLLWEFVKILKPSQPLEAFKNFGLTLVGPFDVFAGKFNQAKLASNEYHLHWRYYYDPPEFQTIIAGDEKTGYHIGYFRDSPTDFPNFVASNMARKDGKFIKMGDNIFAALCHYLEDLNKKANPFIKMQLESVKRNLTNKAEKSGLSLDLSTEKIRQRDIKIVAKTANKLGLIVPYSKKTQLGYRPLPISEEELCKLMQKFQKSLPEQQPALLSELQSVLTAVDIAIDECDFGTGIKLGLDLLFHGHDAVNHTIGRFLGVAYRLLRKDAFATIIEAHMQRRLKDTNLSIV